MWPVTVSGYFCSVKFLTAKTANSFNMPTFGRLLWGPISTLRKLSTLLGMGGTFHFVNLQIQKMCGVTTPQPCNSPNMYGTTSTRNSPSGLWSVLLRLGTCLSRSFAVPSVLCLRRSPCGEELSPTAVRWRRVSTPSSNPGSTEGHHGNSRCQTPCQSSAPLCAHEPSTQGNA